MSNTITPVASSPIASNYQAAGQQAQALQQSQNNNLPQPSKVNPTDKPQDSGVSAQQDDTSKKQQLFDAIKQAVQQHFNYPISNSKYTVFRDETSKQYVAISTSLVDGRITYAPVSDLVGGSPELATALSGQLVTEA